MLFCVILPCLFPPPSMPPGLLQSVCWKHQVFKVPSAQFQLRRRLHRLSLREGLLQGWERSSDDGLYTWVAATGPLCLLTPESCYRLSSWIATAVSQIRCSCKSRFVSKTYLCVKVCIKESLDELHGFCSAASSSLMIHCLSLRLHICIKLQFNRTNSPLIKKLFSCHWDRRGQCLGALQGEIVYLSFTERQSQAAADRLWIFPAVGDALFDLM